jgi:hypothetical protein
VSAGISASPPRAAGQLARAIGAGQVGDQRRRPGAGRHPRCHGGVPAGRKHHRTPDGQLGDDGRADPAGRPGHQHDGPVHPHNQTVGGILWTFAGTQDFPNTHREPNTDSLLNTHNAPNARPAPNTHSAQDAQAAGTS